MSQRRSSIGVADVVAAQRLFGKDLPADVVALLKRQYKAPRADGFDVAVDPAVRPADQGKTISGKTSEAPMQIAQDMLFWMPVHYEKNIINEAGTNAGNGPTEMPSRERQPLPPYPWLTRFESLIPRLREALMRSKPGKALDTLKLVDQLSQGQFPRVLPRKQQEHWGSQLTVVQDFSSHLVPYRRDQLSVAEHLAAFFPPHAYITALCNEHDRNGPRVAADGGPLRCQPGDTLLVISDLGALARDAGRMTDRWQRWSKQWADQGVACIALLPCSLGLCEPQLQSRFQMLCWEHPAPRQLGISDMDVSGEALLDLIAIAGRVEPPLLRSLRRILGLTAYPAAFESWVWSHPEIDAADDSACSLQAEHAQRRRARLQQHHEHYRAALAEATRWLSDHPYELILDSYLGQPAWLLEDESNIQNRQQIQTLQQHAQQLLRVLVHAIGHQGHGFGDAASHWIQELNKRLPESLDHSPETARLRRALREGCQRLQQGLPPAPAERPLCQIRVAHAAASLVVSDSNAATGHRQQLGSVVGNMQTVDGLLELSALPPAVDVWAGVTVMDWISARGADEIGPWVEFQVNAVVQRMRWIPGGEFIMGSPVNEAGRTSSEAPQHSVQLNKGYWLFDTPVTQALWQAVMGSNPAKFKSPNRPVESISWKDAQAFMAKLNQQKPGLALHLPSEAQWEYACRSGSETALYTGPIEILGDNNAPALDAIAWYGGNSGEGFELDNGYDSSGWSKKQYSHTSAGTRPVKQKQGNAWGLFDMLGNVWEWTADEWHDDYEGAPADGSAWGRYEDSQVVRVVRGGSWHADARLVRSAFRDRLDPGDRGDILGFRCARVQAELKPGSADQQTQAARGGVPVAERMAHSLGRAVVATDVSDVALSFPRRREIEWDLLLTTDREILQLQAVQRMNFPWASALGRDCYGLWSEFEIADVRQRLRWIPPGRFVMGSPEEESGRYGDEGPQHEVVLTQGYWLFDTPVTQALWQAVMNDNPSRFKSPTRPVEQVNWTEANAFIAAMNDCVKGLNLSLPSEAQWEYACRAGSETALYSGPIEILGEHNAPALDAIAWYGGNSGEEFELDNGWDTSDWKEQQYPRDRAGTRKVGEKQANGWGLYDMLGNVWEWTADEWHDDYKGAPADGCAWLASEDSETERVVRGGSWGNDARDVRSAFRSRGDPGSRVIGLGFRCARVQAEPQPASAQSARSGVDRPEGGKHRAGRDEAGRNRKGLLDRIIPDIFKKSFS